MNKYTCRECAGDHGWHYDDEGRASRCPNRASTELHKEALALTSVQNAKALEAALAIVRDFAETHVEFSGNATREAMLDAGVPSGTVGAAFSIAAHGTNDHEPCIATTGRFEMSTDPNTRHRIAIWRSLIHPAAVSAGIRKAG